MSDTAKHPVLIIGGSGVVGSQAAATLRRLHPALPISIGGRDLAKARRVAEGIGGAQAVAVDLARPNLGLPAGQAFSAVAIFLKDDTLNTLRYAQAKRIPYLGISTAVFEMGPEVAQFIADPGAAPILMDSNWLAGTTTLAGLHFARDFETLDAIRISALLDEQDVGGPAAHVDYLRQTQAGPSALLLRDGAWAWVAGEEAASSFTSVDGTPMASQVFGNMDLLSLSTATGARSIRFEFALGETASRRRGEPFSTEIVFELTGRRRDGRQGSFRYELVHPGGQAPLTALGVAVGIERLLGLDGGAPVGPGLYLPHVLVDPGYMAGRLEEFGARMRAA